MKTKILITLFLMCSICFSQNNTLDEGKRILKAALEYNDDQFVAYENYMILTLGKDPWNELLVNYSSLGGMIDVLKESFNETRRTSKEYRDFEEQLFNQTLSDNSVSSGDKESESNETNSSNENATGLKAELNELKNLYDQGLINEEEYQAARKKILNK